jgi:hypothetical protein
MRKNRQGSKTEYIEILNSEGPILAAYKTENRFSIVDEDQIQVNVFSEERMLDFIDGKFSIIDSRGRDWNYVRTDAGMKTEREELVSFISSKYRLCREELETLFSNWIKEKNRTFEWEEALGAICDLLESNSHLIRRKDE